MEYRNVGNTGLQVSVVGLGGNNFGGRVDFDGTKAIVEKALDLGITFFDTADAYGVLWGGEKGRSETYLGKLLKPHRRNIVIATKSNGPMGDGPYWAGASRRYLMDALEACLRRLDTDYIDLYEMHRWDPRTPLEETLKVLDDMVRSGKVRYIGCSMYAAWQLIEAIWISKAHDLERYCCILSEFHMLNRSVQTDIIPICQKYGLGLFPLWPLANGFLTGKYRPGAPPPPDSRLALPAPWAEGLMSEKNYDTIVKLEEYGKQHEHTLLEMAMGWLASQPTVPSIMAGATKPEQVEANVKAMEKKLSQQELTEIDAILTA